jgi:hypothetical protein
MVEGKNSKSFAKVKSLMHKMLDKQTRSMAEMDKKVAIEFKESMRIVFDKYLSKGLRTSL